MTVEVMGVWLLWVEISEYRANRGSIVAAGVSIDADTAILRFAAAEDVRTSFMMLHGLLLLLNVCANVLLMLVMTLLLSLSNLDLLVIIVVRE